MNRNIIILFATLTLAIVGIAIVGISFAWKAKNPSQSELTKITLPIPWFQGTQFAFAYVAKEKNYFKEQGLDVKILENKGATITSKLIASGEYPIAVTSADIAMISKSKGLPITVVAVVDKVSPSGITCHKSANVTKPLDLYGKKVGVVTTGNSYQQWLAFLKLKNLDKNQLQEVPISASGAEFLAGKVDCFALYPFLVEANAKTKNIDVNSITFYESGLNMYGQTIAVNSNYLKTNPEMVKKVVKALQKGLAFERENPGQALDIVMKLNPEKKRDYENVVLTGRLGLDKKLPTSIIAYDGVMTDDIWQSMKTILNTFKMLETDVNINELYTNEFVK